MVPVQDVQLEIPYARSQLRFVGRLAFGLLFIGSFSVGLISASLTNDLGLTIFGISFSPSSARWICGAGGVLLGLFGLLFLLQCYEESRRRDWLVLTKTSVIIPNRDGSGPHVIPFNEITKVTVLGSPRSFEPLMGWQNHAESLQICVSTRAHDVGILRAFLPSAQVFYEVERELREAVERWRPPQPAQNPPRPQSIRQDASIPVVVYRVVGVPLERRAQQNVTVTFEDFKKAQAFTQFLQESGKYRSVKVEGYPGESVGKGRDKTYVGTAKLTASETSSEVLGEVLFEWQNPLAKRILVTLVFGLATLLCTILGVVVALRSLGMGPGGPDPTIPFWIPLIFLSAATVFSLALWSYLRFSFRCHEFGISKCTGFGTRCLSYEQIDHVVYRIGVTKLFHVIPIIHHLTVKFMPRPGGVQKKMVFQCSFFGDIELEQLLHELAEILEDNSHLHIIHGPGRTGH